MNAPRMAGYAFHPLVRHHDPSMIVDKPLERPQVIGRICFSTDLFGRRGIPVWVNRYSHRVPMSLHEHDFLEIVLVLEGTADHVTIHGIQPLEPGDLIIIHPGQWHGYQRTGMLIHNCCLSGELFSRELSWVHDDARLGQLFPGRMPRDDRERRAAPQGVRVLRFAGPALAHLLARYDSLQDFTTGEEGVHRGGLVARTLLLLEAIAAHPGLIQAVAGDARVAAAMALMSGEPAHAWSLDELAQRVGVSASHLLKRFRHHAGLAPIAWLARHRAERLAVRLITSSSTVAELGPEVGWDDPSYCARRFKACFGMPPDAYRRHQGSS